MAIIRQDQLIATQTSILPSLGRYSTFGYFPPPEHDMPGPSEPTTPSEEATLAEQAIPSKEATTAEQTMPHEATTADHHLHMILPPLPDHLLLFCLSLHWLGVTDLNAVTRVNRWSLTYCSFFITKAIKNEGDLLYSSWQTKLKLKFMKKLSFGAS
ncbi:hypothetical protein CK203_050350 [Vitis vinifera]|uniref:Uncharacterized protein n=1 Tax=Vitis vinifera TaxID=29760 RepID=A0A438H069_VITVI|nr:hypothetical protein CK203_050350 [Vitis vinifera]